MANLKSGTKVLLFSDIRKPARVFHYFLHFFLRDRKQDKEQKFAQLKNILYLCGKFRRGGQIA